ncbi:MAG TPA: hypothetical protein VLB68_22305 [Pyrinomonadaceae bacterium]|nr:hypothetical protein [Pyrinomonadaceae bacterium]
MSTDTKNLWEVLLTILTMAGATVAFLVSWKQWQRGQEWQRSEQLDKFVVKFESDALLKLAAVVLDWHDRPVTFDGRMIDVQNQEVLLALRDHRDIEGVDKFPGEQPTFRDAYDALLTFFNRIELAIATGLVDREPASAYFSYWLDHLVKFDRHKKDSSVLKGMDPAKLVAAYIWAYGDRHSIVRLCKAFKIDAPDFEAARASGLMRSDEGVVEGVGIDTA